MTSHLNLLFENHGDNLDLVMELLLQDIHELPDFGINQSSLWAYVFAMWRSRRHSRPPEEPDSRLSSVWTTGMTQLIAASLQDVQIVHVTKVEDRGLDIAELEEHFANEFPVMGARTEEVKKRIIEIVRARGNELLTARKAAPETTDSQPLAAGFQRPQRQITRSAHGTTDSHLGHPTSSSNSSESTSLPTPPPGWTDAMTNFFQIRMGEAQNYNAEDPQALDQVIFEFLTKFGKMVHSPRLIAWIKRLVMRQRWAGRRTAWSLHNQPQSLLPRPSQPDGWTFEMTNAMVTLIQLSRRGETDVQHDDADQDPLDVTEIVQAFLNNFPDMAAVDQQRLWAWTEHLIRSGEVAPTQQLPDPRLPIQTWPTPPRDPHPPSANANAIHASPPEGWTNPMTRFVENLLPHPTDLDDDDPLDLDDLFRGVLSRFPNIQGRDQALRAWIYVLAVRRNPRGTVLPPGAVTQDATPNQPTRQRGSPLGSSRHNGLQARVEASLERLLETYVSDPLTDLLEIDLTPVVDGLVEEYPVEEYPQFRDRTEESILRGWRLWRSGDWTGRWRRGGRRRPSEKRTRRGMELVSAEEARKWSLRGRAAGRRRRES